MLTQWGIYAARLEPRRISRELCDRAAGIFVMAPSYLHRLLRDHGDDLGSKAYLFADPFTRPVSFGRGEYKVHDPGFDRRPTGELAREFAWMRERVLQIRVAMLGDSRPLVPVSEYLELCRGVDPLSH